MTNFKVVILENSEDTDIYTEPTRLSINRDSVEVEYKKRIKIYSTEAIKEIQVTVNR